MAQPEPVEPPATAARWPLQGALYRAGFLLPTLLTLLPFLHFHIGRHAAAAGVIFAGIALAELLLPQSKAVPAPAAERRHASMAYYELILLLQLPLQLLLLAYALAQVRSMSGILDVVGAGLAVGLVSGSIGITFAHELGHRRARGHRLLGHGLMACVGYGHFMVEHYRGHHLHVATPADPATARAGESVYAFWLRTIPAQWASAWRLEAARLGGDGVGGGSGWSWRNVVLWHGLWALAAPLLLGALLGWQAALFWLVQAALAILLLESVNYVEHYGLARRRLADGRYEPVGSSHSWNTYAQPSNWLLIHLQRHSDHHTYPGRPYALLRPTEGAPELPTGYGGSVLLALVPPLWRRLMAPRLAALRAAASG
jgi:alkane 1-monooxygenase